jgi:hypothetical protein
LFVYPLRPFMIIRGCSRGFSNGSNRHATFPSVFDCRMASTRVGSPDSVIFTGARSINRRPSDVLYEKLAEYKLNISD